MSVIFLIRLSKKLDIRKNKDSQISCYLTWETMNTSLKHLSAGQQRSLQRVISIIVRAIQPEKIVLFGVYGRAGKDGLPAGLSPEALPPVLGAYDLLIVT